jgi:hypothetical protein
MSRLTNLQCFSQRIIEMRDTEEYFIHSTIVYLTVQDFDTLETCK